MLYITREEEWEEECFITFINTEKSGLKHEAKLTPDLSDKT